MKAIDNNIEKAIGRYLTLCSPQKPKDAEGHGQGIENVENDE
jgi:hypothetical protein